MNYDEEAFDVESAVGTNALCSIIIQYNTVLNNTIIVLYSTIIVLTDLFERSN